MPIPKDSNLIVNDAGVMQQNIYFKVNSSDIRREDYNGREHIVVKSYTLPDNVVMNGGLYPKEEVDKHYTELEGTLAPLSHPEKDGEFISATTAEAINSFHIGAWNRNVKREGDRITLEKWVDVQYAMNTEGGRRFIEAVESGETIHTSVAAFVRPEKAAQGRPYEWVARIVRFDHDAILLDEVGAATPEQGVGINVNAQLMVNGDNGVRLAANGLLDGSYQEKYKLISDAVKLAHNKDDWAYVEDFNDTHVIVTTREDQRLHEYSISNGIVSISDRYEPVEKKIDWVSKVLRVFKAIPKPFRTVVNSEMSKLTKEDIDVTKEELQAMLDAQAENLRANMESSIADINAKLEAVQSENKTLHDQLAANSQARLTEKRKAASEFVGELVANAISDEAALDDIIAKNQTAAPIGGAIAANAGEEFDAAAYIKSLGA